MNYKKRLSFLLLLSLSAAFLFAGRARAKVKPSYPSSQTLYLGTSSEYGYELEGVSKSSEISKLKSSNKKIATVSVRKEEGDPHPVVWIKPKKTGKAKVTFDVKYKDKTLHLKGTVYIWKYVNPFVKLKIGKTDYSSQWKEGDYYVAERPIEGKVSYKLKKNWKISKMQIYDCKSNVKEYKSLKNKKIKLKKGMTLLFDVRYKNDKNHEQTFSILID